MTIKVNHIAKHHTFNQVSVSTVNGEIERPTGMVNSVPCSEVRIAEQERSQTLLRRDSYQFRGSFGFLVMKL